MNETKITPEQALAVLNQINESMFGQKKWNELVEQADKDMKSLLHFGVTSKRDRMIFNYALHIGIKYGVAYSHALRSAQKPLNIIKNFFTRKVRK
jgi:hypothetical protein